MLWHIQGQEIYIHEGGTKVVSAGSTDWDAWANTYSCKAVNGMQNVKMIGDTYHFVGVGSEDTIM